MATKIKKDTEAFIKIPTDFKELNDLKELVTNYEFSTKLFNALKNYQMDYINSFVMDSKSVIEYIPKSHHKNYGVRSGENLEKISEFRKTLNILLNDTSKSCEKVFMPDTKNQEIVHCHWLDKPNTFYRSDGIDFDINDGILIVKVNIIEKCSQAIGGVWINGRSGYLSGAHYEPYDRKGYEIHHYCTKTNQYLGYQKTVMDPERKWIRKTSRY
jgi:hypothetical protein